MRKILLAVAVTGCHKSSPHPIQTPRAEVDVGPKTQEARREIRAIWVDVFGEDAVTREWLLPIAEVKTTLRFAPIYADSRGLQLMDESLTNLKAAVRSRAEKLEAVYDKGPEWKAVLIAKEQRHLFMIDSGDIITTDWNRIDPELVAWREKLQGPNDRFARCIAEAVTLDVGEECYWSASAEAVRESML